MSRIESETVNKNINYIVFGSIPVGFILGFFKFSNIYDMIGLILFLAVLCFVYNQFNRLNGENGEQPANTINEIIGQTGFIITVAGALLSDRPGINWIFILGILLGAVFAGTIQGLAMVCVYVALITMFSGASATFTTISLITAVLCVVLMRYMDNIWSLPYIIITVLCLVTALYVILNKFSITDLFTAEHLYDLLIIVGSFFLTYILADKTGYCGGNIRQDTEPSGKAVDAGQVKKAELSDSIGESVEDAIAASAEEVTDLEIDSLAAEYNSAFSGYEGEGTAAYNSTDIVVTEPANPAILPTIDAPVENFVTAADERALEKTAEEPSTPKIIDYSGLVMDGYALYDEMKKNEKLYQTALIRSFLAEGAAEQIKLNASLAAAGAFYCECGRLISKNYIKEGILLARKYELPEAVANCIREHNFKLGHPGSPESAIIMIVDKLDNTIEFFSGSGRKFSAQHIIDEVTDSCLMDGRLDGSGLSITEYKIIKDYLLKEVPKTYAYFN